MVLLAALWLVAASRVHVNASWSDGAWGYAVLPLFGQDPMPGDLVLFEPPDSVGSRFRISRPCAACRAWRSRSGRTERSSWTARPWPAPRAARSTGGRWTPSRRGRFRPGRFHLHADHPDSHDSRYAEIGLVPRDRILGRAFALPDIPWLGLDGPLAGPEDAAPSPVSVTEAVRRPWNSGDVPEAGR